MPVKSPKKLINTYTPTVFNIDDVVNWKSYLDINGYVVLNDVISKEDTEIALNLFKNEITQVSPNFKWDDTSTMINSNTPMVWSKSSVVFNGFGQSDSNWHIRLNSKTKNVFQKVYNDDDLVVSFDGFSLFLSDTQKSESWIHQDQRPSDKRLSYQGILNLFECNEHDAGFICVPKTHKTYIPKTNNNSDWCMVPKDSILHKETLKLLTPERSLILFNSKLVHANIGMSKNHPKGVHLNRLSCYITFVPRNRQTKEVKDERIKGYYNGISTSHWADRCEIKQIPFYLKSKYASYNFNTIKPKLTNDNKIPNERYVLI